MPSLIQEIESQFKKSKVVDVKSGDTVRVHQKIKEGNKERVQVFEGLVIKTARMNSHTATIWVRRIASGVGVEKSYRIHSPLVTKIEVVKRAKVRRNYLSYMRERSGKSARLGSVAFDKDAVNDVAVPIDDTKAAAEAEEALVDQPKEAPKDTVAKSEKLAEEEKAENVTAEETTEAETQPKPAEPAKEEPAPEQDKPEAAKDDKAAAKKAKAEEFRKKQEEKKNS